MKNRNEIDIQLIREIKEGNYGSYNMLFNCYYTSLCRYIYSITNDKNDSEDIAQELFLNLWANKKSLDVHTNVSAYLYKSARNLTLNHIRNNLKYRSVVDKIELESCCEEDVLEVQEFRNSLNDCINRLSLRCKEVLLMHRIEGLKQKEIADKLNISVKTIKNQIWVSLQYLRKCLNLKQH